MKNIIIFGTGGNCIDILDTINEINIREPKYKCLGFLDDNPNNLGKIFYGVKVLGPLSLANTFHDTYFINGIGSALNFWKKEKIIHATGIPLHRFETLIHPTASVSRMSNLGRGIVVFQNAAITSNVSIGNHVVILPNSILSHDVVIGEYTCITGGVCISGGVKIGTSCYLGTNSSIIGNISIGNNCLIGMGSTVISNVAENSVMIGNPAKFLRNTIPAL